jgi:hypothetical protein
MKKEKKNDSNDLIMAIKKRSAERAEQMDSFVARMEAKYCQSNRPKKAKKITKKTK